VTVYEKVADALTSGGHPCTEEHVRWFTWRAMWNLIGENYKRCYWRGCGARACGCKAQP
jgi:hypothetical protein